MTALSPLLRRAATPALFVALALGARGLSGAGVGSLGLAPEPGERTEHFVLRLPAEPPPADAEREPEPPPLAFAEWRRRRADGGWQLELDLVFPDDDLRVYAVECLTARGPRLVWREVSPGAGRTLLAEWTARGAKLRLLEWGPDGSVREGFETEQGAVMPLYLAELARLGRLNAGEQLVLDPLARALEPQSLRTTYASDPEGAGFVRVVELRRADQGLAARYVFRGDELLAFELQEGGWRAERISAQEHARALEAREVRARQGLELPPDEVKDL